MGELSSNVFNHHHLINFFQSRLCSVFPIEEDYESQVWQGLVLVGVGLTLATLVMVGRR